MDADAALKKVFAKLDELGKRLDEVDPNGKLDELKKEMQRVSSNSAVVVSTVHAHGSSIRRLEGLIENLLLNCPAATSALSTPEVELPGNGGERLRPGSNEYEALRASEEDDGD